MNNQDPLKVKIDIKKIDITLNSKNTPISSSVPIKRTISIKKKDQNNSSTISNEQSQIIHENTSISNVILTPEEISCIDKDIEIWRQIPIPKFIKYDVSTHGRVRNHKSGKILKLQIRAYDYTEVCLQLEPRPYPEHKGLTQKLHLLIASTWLSNTEGKSCINHIDHNPANNNVKNLEWATITENNNKRNLPSKKNIYKRENGQNMTIWRIDLNTNTILETHPSITATAKWIIENKLSTNSIGRITTLLKTAINNKTIYCGFKWMFKNVDTYLDEIWQEIPSELIDGITTGYYISDYGRIKDTNGKIREGTDNAGYLETSIGKKNHLRIHRLVAQVFIPNPENKLHVNHINGIKHDNRLTNLEWATPKENQQHKVDTGLSKSTKSVILFTETGEFIKEYKSGAELDRDLKFTKPAISVCCNGEAKFVKKDDKKYITRFKTDVEKANILGISPITPPLLIRSTYDKYQVDLLVKSGEKVHNNDISETTTTTTTTTTDNDSIDDSELEDLLSILEDT